MTELTDLHVVVRSDVAVRVGGSAGEDAVARALADVGAVEVRARRRDRGAAAVRLHHRVGEERVVARGMDDRLGLTEPVGGRRLRARNRLGHVPEGGGMTEGDGRLDGRAGRATGRDDRGVGRRGLLSGTGGANRRRERQRDGDRGGDETGDNDRSLGDDPAHQHSFVQGAARPSPVGRPARLPARCTTSRTLGFRLAERHHSWWSSSTPLYGVSTVSKAAALRRPNLLGTSCD